jgi:hypothetical protein
VITRFLKSGSQNELKPIFLQEIAEANEPHESIHTLVLENTPELVRGELPYKPGSIYTQIHEHTMNAIKLPSPLSEPLVSDFHPDTCFYPEPAENGQQHPNSLRPVLTVSDAGRYLQDIAGMPVSSFGKQIDEWLAEIKI